MSSANIITTNHGVFQEFLVLIGKMVQSELVKEIEYLRVENQIMRNKLGKYVRLTPSERQRILKFGLHLEPYIRKVINIVDYSEFIGSAIPIFFN